MRKFDSTNRRSFNSNAPKKDFKSRRFRRPERNNNIQGTVVHLREGESSESLIRRFKKIVELSGVMRELKKREHYLSPSQKRKEKRKKALKRARKEAKKVAPNFQDRE